jgi:hypothetical protein
MGQLMEADYIFKLGNKDVALGLIGKFGATYKLKKAEKCSPRIMKKYNLKFARFFQ